MGRILLLSNGQDLDSKLRRDMEAMGHSVIVAPFDNAGEAIHTRRPDLIMADLTLPGDIVEVWRQLQYDMADSHVPVIALVSKDRIREIELLTKMIDFILKPYEARELEIRIKLILRNQPKDAAGDIIKIGNLTIDATKYEVTIDGWPIVLTLKEYELLKYLATRSGRVITREVLLDQVWGYDYYGGTRTVDVHIGRLRTKIETREYSFIRTVRGVGYVFADEYSEDEEQSFATGGSGEAGERVRNEG